VKAIAAFAFLAIVAAGCKDDAPVADELASAVANEPPKDLIGIDARFGERVELIGYLLEPRTLTHPAGSTVKLTLVWRVDDVLDDGFLPFTHLVDKRGQLLENFDKVGPLRAGAPPPSRWPKGKIVLDRVDVALPADAPDTVAVACGFYRGGERLSASGGGVDVARRAALIKLRVSGSKAAELPALEVPRLGSGTVKIDGALDEAVWAHAVQTRPFVNVSTGRQDPRLPVQGRARLLYDETFFYIGVEVEDAAVRGRFSRQAKDPHLWTADTVEIMIDPDGDGDNRDYYEIQIGPQNLLFDSQFDDYNEPRGGADGPFGHEDWAANLVSAAKIDGTLENDRDRDQGYVVEAKIRWSSFGKARRIPPQPGDRWRMNFYAIAHPAAAAWSPIVGQGNFHRASRFGRITFGARTVQ
jgi:cellulose/xylan binding protein with CBM9 domain